MKLALKSGDTVVFDLDGVVFSQAKLFEVLKREYPTCDPYNLKYYSIERSLKLQGVLADNVTNFESQFFKAHGEEIFTGCVVREDTKMFITYLGYKNIDIHYVTARPNTPENESIVKQVFDKGGLPYKNCHFLGTYDKKTICNELGAKLLIEDRAETLLDCISGEEATPLGILVGYTYNEQTPSHKNMHRLEDFNLGALLELEKQKGWLSGLTM